MKNVDSMLVAIALLSFGLTASLPHLHMLQSVGFDIQTSAIAFGIASGLVMIKGLEQ
jgi:hypothetical protein